MPTPRFTSLEICAGAGGQALGLEQAGFAPLALIDNDRDSCETLRANREEWNVLEADLLTFDPAEHPYLYDVDLMAAGPPRVRSLNGGKQLPQDLEARRLLKATIYLVHAVRPRALLIENIADLVESAHLTDLRAFVRDELEHLGYELHRTVLDAADFGVPQERRQGFFVALRKGYTGRFQWPEPVVNQTPTVGDVLEFSMAERGWPHASDWAAWAARPAPTIVGGSKNRGGPDLGQSGSKAAWEKLGVNGNSLGDAVPAQDFPWPPETEDRKLLPKLTIPQVATLQSFPPRWELRGNKTSRYCQIGHASPPPVAAAMGRAIAAALGDEGGPGRE
ncbi:5-methylcytosine methyltransferase [Streptomyces eurocidicus]|uniref:DNA (cytosine-5-)-methyltransferase n=1 Tax=Streptomyces eurocidicus TaxID=66423 RepID=A0A2N8NYQ6_STREU|nr:DNA cytosine methyltransferase [Streptomyces eurocidicus]MBF6051080.1 DNA cytosine methyltransferase [Streptomyces eurocidicus]PNE33897.1 5-methylcytosine methyltransferase [Streptomyces eurocidicus]